MQRYSEKFKARMRRRLVGPNAITATQLSIEVGVPQTTLSRWRQRSGRARVIMAGREDEGRQEHERGSTANAAEAIERGRVVEQRRPADWPGEEKLAAVLEATALPEAELGAFLRRKALHKSDVDQWRQVALEALDGGKGRARRRAGSAEAKRIRELERELDRKDKALAETAALVVLKKKLRVLWSDEDDDDAGRSER